MMTDQRTYLITTETFQTPYQQFEDRHAFADLGYNSARFIDHQVANYRSKTPDSQITYSGKLNGEDHLDYQAFDTKHHQIIAHAIIDRIG